MATFSDGERTALLAVKGVGPRVVARLEELGISSFEELSKHHPGEICRAAAAVVGSTCWKNSPQARAAISAAIARVRLPGD